MSLIVVVNGIDVSGEGASDGRFSPDGLRVVFAGLALTELAPQKDFDDLSKTMGRRARYVSLILLLVLAGFACLLYVARDRVTPAAFEKIDVGMTSLEVEELFQRPADQVMRIHGMVRDSSTFVAVPRGKRQKLPRHQLRQWDSAELTAIVIFENDRVVCRYTADGQPNARYLQFFNTVKRTLGLSS